MCTCILLENIVFHFTSSHLYFHHRAKASHRHSSPSSLLDVCHLSTLCDLLGRFVCDDNSGSKRKRNLEKDPRKTHYICCFLPKKEQQQWQQQNNLLHTVRFPRRFLKKLLTMNCTVLARLHMPQIAHDLLWPTNWPDKSQFVNKLFNGLASTSLL